MIAERAEKQKKTETKKRKLPFSESKIKKPRPKVKEVLKEFQIDDDDSSTGNSVSSGDSNLVVSEEEVDFEFISPTDENLGINDFVLVKFCTKRTIKYFVGQIEDKIGLSEFKISF